MSSFPLQEVSFKGWEWETWAGFCQTDKPCTPLHSPFWQSHQRPSHRQVGIHQSPGYSKQQQTDRITESTDCKLSSATSLPQRGILGEGFHIHKAFWSLLLFSFAAISKALGVKTPPRSAYERRRKRRRGRMQKMKTRPRLMRSSLGGSNLQLIETRKRKIEGAAGRPSWAW